MKRGSWGYLILRLGLCAFFVFVPRGEVKPQTVPLPVESGEVTLISASGKVRVQASGSAGWKEVKPPAVLRVGDKVETGQDSYAVLFFNDKSTMKLAESSRVALTRLDMSQGDKTIFSRVQLELGKIWVNVQKFLNKESSFEVESGNALAAVHGTVFEMDGSDEEASMNVWEGMVDFQSGAEKVSVGQGNRIRLFRKQGRFEKGLFDRNRMSEWQKWNSQADQRIREFRNKMPALVRGNHKELQSLHKQLHRFQFKGRFQNFRQDHHRQLVPGNQKPSIKPRQKRLNAPRSKKLGSGVWGQGSGDARHGQLHKPERIRTTKQNRLHPPGTGWSNHVRRKR
ncbi:MAG: FecR domain-containing protein [Armatimonadetes bacterium]|nr:FecR domain-containing protein [Armatimonadota bacterium]